jgi:tRNA A-37 threonylcarbamoyl transferase component Bud32
MSSSSLEPTLEQLTAVNLEIQAVQEDIATLEEELKATTDETDKLYLHKEEEKLWKKEEQLDDRVNMLNDRVNILMQQQRPPVDLAAVFKELRIEMKALVNDLKETIVASTTYNPRASPLLTPAHLGDQELKHMIKFSQVKDWVATEEHDPAPVLTQAQALELAGTADEHEVIAFLTPHLADIFAGVGLVLINSEEYAWLKTSTGKNSELFKQKPDMLACHPAVYKREHASKASDHVQQRRQGNFKFGVLSDWYLRDGIATVLEAKTESDNASFGEVINYGRRISAKLDRPSSVRVIIFDKTEFWLASFKDGACFNVDKCNWVQQGSRQLLEKFANMREPWLCILDAVCLQLGVKPVEGEAFLGFGSYGRVFRVVKKKSSSSSRSPQLALKIVCGVSMPLLYEAQHLRMAKSLAEDIVIGVEGEVVEVTDGAGLLLSCVGRPVLPDKKYVDKVVSALVELHRRKIVHGDPRLPNIVAVGQGLQWIDFREARFDSSIGSAFVNDMRILAASFVQLDAKNLIGELNSAVLAYDPNNSGSVDAKNNLVNHFPLMPLSLALSFA